MDFRDKLKASRRISDPLIAIETGDQQACIQTIIGIYGPKIPIVQWDVLSGMSGVKDPLGNVSELGQAALIEALTQAGGGEALDQKATTNPVDALNAALFLPANTVFIMQNCHYLFTDGQRVTDGMIAFSQGLANCREPFKRTRRQVILLAPFIKAPQEIAPDLTILSEPAPDGDQLAEVVRTNFKNWNATNKTKLDDPDEKTVLVPAINALRGIETIAAADRTVAMALTKSGLDIDLMYDRKRISINDVPGLQVMPGKSTFADLEGIEFLKEDWRQVLNGRRPVRLMLFQDEIEKGYGQDTSGTRDEILQQTLTEMQERNYTGYIFIGPPGTGKSALAKAMAGEAGVECVAQSVSGTKSKWVGESAAQQRRQFKLIQAMSGGEGVVCVASCNSISALPPELKRRYTLGIFVVKFPTEAERKAIWDLYFRKYELPEQPLPDDFGWTGAEIKNCCDRAWCRRITVIQAARGIVPVAVSDKDRLTKLQMEWSNKYIDASTGDVFKYAEQVRRVSAMPGRRISSEEE